MDLANWIATLSQTLTALIAMIATFFAWRQLKSARRLQMENTAHHLYGEQLRLDLQYPLLAYPDLGEIRLNHLYADYISYISHLLYTCDTIIYSSDTPYWRKNICYYLAFHRDYLSQKPEIHDYYSDALKEVIQNAIESYEELVDVDLRSPFTPSDYKGGRLSPRLATQL